MPNYKIIKLWWRRNKKGKQNIKYVKSISPVTLTKKPEEALVINHTEVMELVPILDDSYELLPIKNRPNEKRLNPYKCEEEIKNR